MCGIFGAINHHSVAPDLIEGLARLEYRGYDSAGVATVVDGRIERRRAAGPIQALRDFVDGRPLGGHLGIAHTRWATHGAANEQNAHPHVVGRVAVVHNGIVENFHELRDQLREAGVVFASDTDTELIAHLIAQAYDAGLSPRRALRTACARIEGSYALAVLFADRDDRILVTRRGSPLVLAPEKDGAWVSSDALALAPVTDVVMPLEEGDLGILTRHGVLVFDAAGGPVERPLRRLMTSRKDVGRDGFPHYMLKEIHQQPQTTRATLEACFERRAGTSSGVAGIEGLANASHLAIIACGTSRYAGMVAREWFERIAGLPVILDIASEMRHREAPRMPGGLALFISQSGETADTLAAMRHCKAAGQRTLAVVNVPESAMAREADHALLTHAGPEIGVASTKAFTAQLVALASIVLEAARQRGRLDDAGLFAAVQQLSELPALLAETLEYEPRLAEMGRALAGHDRVLYLGRGAGHALALEGALKLKEISYIHAEGFAAGELKHGPLALVEEGTAVVALCASDRLFEKMRASLQEVEARGARVLALTDSQGAPRLTGERLALPTGGELTRPFVDALALQLLAYHAATARGCDVDRPRNLAKSVTVE